MPLKTTMELVRIDAGHDIFLDGVIWIPISGGSETAIALFPGTGAEFYNSLFTYLGPRLAAVGYTTLAINRRDHGVYFGFHTLAEGAADQGKIADYCTITRTPPGQWCLWNSSQFHLWTLCPFSTLSRICPNKGLSCT